MPVWRKSALIAYGPSLSPSLLPAMASVLMSSLGSFAVLGPPSKRWRAVAALASGLAVGAPVSLLAQDISPSGKFPTTVTQSGSNYTITGGTVAGQKLLHGFSTFNIPSGGSATFDGSALPNSSMIKSIYGVVSTGASTLNGALNVQGFGSTSPALYLMNPNGIILGSGFSTNIQQLNLFASDGLLIGCSSSINSSCINDSLYSPSSGQSQYLLFNNDTTESQTFASSSNSNGFFWATSDNFMGVVSDASPAKVVKISASNLTLSVLGVSGAIVDFQAGSVVNAKKINIFAQWFAGAATGSEVSNLAYGKYDPTTSTPYNSSVLFTVDSAQAAVAPLSTTTNMLLATPSLYTSTSALSLAPGSVIFAGAIKSNPVSYLSLSADQAEIKLGAKVAYISEVSFPGGTTSPFGPNASVATSQAPYYGVYYGFGATIAIDPAINPAQYINPVSSNIPVSSNSGSANAGSTGPATTPGASGPGPQSNTETASSPPNLIDTGTGSTSSNVTPSDSGQSKISKYLNSELSDKVDLYSADTSAELLASLETSSQDQAESPYAEGLVQGDNLEIVAFANPFGSAVSASSSSASDPVSGAGLDGGPDASVVNPIVTVSASEVATSFNLAEQVSVEQTAAALTIPASAPLSPQQAQSKLLEARGAVRNMSSVASRQLPHSGLVTGDSSTALFASAASPVLSDAGAVISPLFNRLAYNPAILQLRFTEVQDRVSTSETDAFLDVILIPSEGEIVGKRVEVSTGTFTRQLKSLYSQLSRQEDLRVLSPGSPARQLYNILIAPIAQELNQLKVTTLLIGADRGLQGIPFAALHSGSQFLGERFAFALTPSLSLTDLTPVQSGERRLLAAGASQFEGLTSLPLVPQELQAISATQASDALLDSAFTPATLEITAAEPRFDRIHLATHAEFLPGGPAKSKIYSGTAPLPLSSLSTLRRNRRGVPLDLIVLSACRTALGDADSELGFAGLALQAGARSAIGTLWYVDDVATSAYFVQLYRYLQLGLPKAEALQFTRLDFATGRVQLSDDQILAGDGQILLSGLTTAQQRRVAAGLGNPYFWAGIELLGSPW